MQNNGVIAHSGEDSHEEISDLGLVLAVLQKLKTFKKHVSGLIRLEQPQQGIASSIVPPHWYNCRRTWMASSYFLMAKEKFPF